MKKSSIADNISAKNIAGYTTETMLWHFVKDIAHHLLYLHDKGMIHGNLYLDNVHIKGNTFCLTEEGHSGSSSDDMWHFGACIYELITGNLPFGGKGKEGQSPLSPLPSFHESLVSKSLSELTKSCLSYNESDRITAKEALAIAEKKISICKEYISDIENLKYKKPQSRNIRLKTYKFWPEAMFVFFLSLFFTIPQYVSAQYNTEVEKLIRLTTTMRNSSKRAQVLNELMNDKKWTLMDQLIEHGNECNYKDKVSEFGMNHIAAEIAQREKGIVNVGGRFRNSTNKKYNYSFYELTAKAGTTISYRVDGHKGTQQIAIVPFHKDQQYIALVSSDGKHNEAHTKKEGIAYLTVEVDKNGSYMFSITNKDKRNACFVIITYNPWK